MLSYREKDSCLLVVCSCCFYFSPLEGGRGSYKVPLSRCVSSSFIMQLCFEVKHFDCRGKNGSDVHPWNHLSGRMSKLQILFLSSYGHGDSLIWMLAIFFSHKKPKNTALFFSESTTRVRLEKIDSFHREPMFKGFSFLRSGMKKAKKCSSPDICSNH